MKNGDTLQETAAKGVEAIHTIVKERDVLLVDNDRMKTDIALLRQKCAQLESRLGTAQPERDHYMRFSTELVSDLNNIQGIIHSARRGGEVGGVRASPGASAEEARDVVGYRPEGHREPDPAPAAEQWQWRPPVVKSGSALFAKKHVLKKSSPIISVGTPG